MVRARSVSFPHLQPVPCCQPLGPSEVHERASSTTPPENLSLGYTKVFEAFISRKYACRLTIRNTDGSFADLQKALRTRLNISKNEPLVIKQVDGDYTLDIETGPPSVGPCFVCLQLTRVPHRGGV